ncbi:hypothetical protein [Poseidonibacter lekithochrous]|uniref:hypothetical protein n=1 Tax=Poseidonibacter lekithochrous TaxID=1904463 RepID=UPI000A82FFCD|nr:hypothetical protein [Poseidonibacter lekithochrous]QKJ23969.1 putative membrane protein [Poseidonibacter lekithochrous]
MNLINCPECNHEILDRIGTICPSCGHNVTYFEGDKKRKLYGKFFAMSIFFPFISFITIVFTSGNLIALSIASILYLFLATVSCPLRFKDLFFTGYEKLVFWVIWGVANSFLIAITYNSFSKLL